MKRAIATFLAATFLATAASADPSMPGAAPERSRAVMLYFSKSFGAPSVRERQPMNFGLRLQQTSPFNEYRQIALLDARYSLGGRQQLLLGGLNAFDSAEDGNSSDRSAQSSVTMSQRHPGWTAAVIALAVIGGACVFEVVICDNQGGNGTNESPGLGRGRD